MITKSLFNVVVVEDTESNMCFPDTVRTDESDGFEVFSKLEDLPNQLIASETGTRPWGR